MNFPSLRRAIRTITGTAATTPAVVSFPKSGRTWLRVMLTNAGVEVDYSHGGSDHIAGRTPDELRSQLETFLRRPVLFLLRDPLDTAVSGFFQASKRLQKYDGDIHTFLRSPQHGLEKIVRFNLLWLENQGRFRDFCVLGYEDMHEQPAAELRKAISFLTGREPGPGIVEKAVEAGRFDNMRKVEARGEGAATYGDWLAPVDASDTDTFKTRRGVVGGWRDYLNEDDARYAEEIFGTYDYQRKVEELRRRCDSDRES